MVNCIDSNTNPFIYSSIVNDTIQLLNKVIVPSFSKKTTTEHSFDVHGVHITCTYAWIYELPC